MPWPGRKKPTPPGPSREQALACVPVRNPAVRELPATGETLRLRYPLAVRPLAARLARLLGQADPPTPTKTIELDALGAFTWKRINGADTVAAIAAAIADHYGLHPREAELATATFLQTLGKRGIIALRDDGGQGRPGA